MANSRYAHTNCCIPGLSVLWVIIGLDSTTAINDGNWHHVAVTAPPTGSMFIYVDGIQSGSLNNGHALLATTTDRLLVGATSLAAGAYYMMGSMDE